MQFIWRCGMQRSRFSVRNRTLHESGNELVDVEECRKLKKSRPGRKGEIPMKCIYARVPALLLSLILSPAANSGLPQADDASKVVAMENLWNQMQLNHDAVAMEKMLDEDFVLTDYDGSLLSKSQFLESIKDPSIKLTLEMSEGMKLHQHGVTVVITGATRERGTQNGKPFAHNGRFTDTWIKKDGRWLCVASHLGVISK
jgi:ketosteroid isomerase-like protein